MLDAMIAGFETDAFCGFLRSKFPSFSESRRPLRLDAEFPWDSAEQIGIVKKLTGPNGLNMPLLVVVAALPEGEPLRERSSRLRQFTFARKVLGQAMAAPSPGIEGVITQGLFVFHDAAGNFRLSLVFGKAEGTKLVWSTARRLSFHVEAGAGNKTFRDRMALPWASFDKLKEAFSVEKLTKEFYNRLFSWYQWALSDDVNVTYPNNPDSEADDREINEHIIRLITRLMFVWFLKQKHLVPDNLFDPAELSKNLKTFSPVSGDNYYRAILQNLFFATLNSEIPERAFAVDAGNIRENKEHFGIKTLYRYGSEFTMGEDKVLALFRSIPFLNGGLFECLDKEQSYVDGFSRNPKKQAHIPNRLFFDTDKGLIPLLEQYNFTVEENSPGDEEVALDPELLGKVFENLLGAYNPETKVAARNATGSFYTPREIVNYMVDESLKAHLLSKLTTEHTEDTEREMGKDSRRGAETQREEAVKQLFENGERPGDETLCRQIDDALVTAKILDPACGSGAFPMGILLRMVELLRVLRQIPDDDHDAIYDLKLQLIENCIYGGDIQCIAVQISKLRFFISLVCEQKPTTNAAKNYGIHTLPNLETKFVAADSLIGLPRRGDFLPMQNVETLKKELWSVRHKHFTARSYREKKELRKEDKRLRTALAKELELGGGFDTESARLMAAWDPYDQNTSAPFSDPEWMFNVKDGFDVVIGNPPYVNVELIPSATKVLYKKLYKTFFKRFDLFGLFYEAALLHFAGDRGCVSFIIPQQIANNMSYSKLRDLMLDHGWLRDVLYLGDKVFEAANNDVCVMSLCKTGNEYIRLVYALDFDNHQITVVPSGYFKQYGNVISFGSDLGGEAIFQKMFSVKGCKLKDKFKVFQGIVTGNNSAFLPSAEDIKEAHLEADLLKPVLLGRDFEKWAVRSSERRILYVDSLTPINEYPRTRSWLSRFQDELTHGRSANERSTEWYCLHRPRDRADLDCVPKLLVQGTRNPRLVKRIVATFDDQGLYGTQGVNFVVPRSNGAPIHFLLGVLNSKLINYLYATKFLNVAIKAEYLKDTPIPKASDSDQENVAALVKKILAAKKSDPAADTSVWEAEIDRLVYALYGLTEEEIAIVEGAGGQKSETGGRKKGGKQKSVAEPDSGGQEAEVPPSVGRPASGVPKKKPAPRKLKANLPPSLPGWD